jgi:long-subunit acyl-CoA synthetase (AMP-forming)
VAKLLETLQEHASSQGLAIALMGHGWQINYQALWLVVRKIGDELRARRVRHLVINADNSPDWVLLDLACLYARITSIALPVFFSAEQRKHVLDTVRPDLILSDDELCPQGYSPAEGVEELSFQVAEPHRRHKSRYPSAKITFTSGTTGSPNGVHISRTQIDNLLAALELTVPVTEGVDSLSLLPMSVLLENLAGVYLSLLKGGRHSCPSAEQRGLPGSSAANPHQVIQCLAKHQTRAFVTTPALAEIVVNACHKGMLNPEQFQFVAVGGSKVPQSLLGKARSLHLPLFEGYGLSECGSVVTLNTPGNNKEGSVGKLLPHIECRAVQGELQLRGNTSPGYLCGAEHAGQNFSEDDWWLTGDLGHVDGEGFVYITGRKKNVLINSYGRNVSPEWVEALAEEHEIINRMLLLGNGEPHCTALIDTDDSGEKVSAAIQAINRTLPDYARVLDWRRANLSPRQYPAFYTADGSPRRASIAKFYRTRIASMYPSTKGM